LVSKLLKRELEKMFDFIMKLEVERTHFVYRQPLLLPRIPLTAAHHHKRVAHVALRKKEMPDRASHGQFFIIVDVRTKKKTSVRVFS
jgi:hypothetical protein